MGLPDKGKISWEGGSAGVVGMGYKEMDHLGFWTGNFGLAYWHYGLLSCRLRVASQIVTKMRAVRS